jgi:effector-binding domain-containing protein
MLRKILSGLLALCLSSCSIIGVSDTPQAKYSTEKSQDEFAIRIYKPLVEAQITVKDDDYKSAVNKGFRALFKYITGANSVNQKISMTTPVITENNSQNIEMTAPVFIADSNNSWTIAFVLPDNYTLDTAPKPTNSDIKLVAKPQNKVAVITFNGSLNKDSIDENTKKLKTWISENDIKVVGEPMAAGYNPPWTIPYFRRNEIQISIE